MCAPAVSSPALCLGSARPAPAASPLVRTAPNNFASSSAFHGGGAELGGLLATDEHQREVSEVSETENVVSVFRSWLLQGFASSQSDFSDFRDFSNVLSLEVAWAAREEGGGRSGKTRSTVKVAVSGNSTPVQWDRTVSSMVCFQLHTKLFFFHLLHPLFFSPDLQKFPRTYRFHNGNAKLSCHE